MLHGGHCKFVHTAHAAAPPAKMALVPLRSTFVLERCFCHPCHASSSSVSFFFQAEDGIRDYKVTGVQTCALPIWGPVSSAPPPANLLALTKPFTSSPLTDKFIAIVPPPGLSSLSSCVPPVNQAKLDRKSVV